MDFINQTMDLVILLDNSYWVTSIVKPTHLHVSCFTTSYYKELKHPLDITYLGDSCEGFTSTMLLPASNVIKINDPIQLHGNMGSFAQLNYSNVHDFTVFEDITITKVNISKLSSIPDIPDFTDTTVVNLNKKLTEISLEYPWELPLWSKIVITVVLTLVVVAVSVTYCICHHHGKC